MLYVGLTGNIASGKSEVAKLLAMHGATIIDADVLAREVVAPGTPALHRIVKRWGSGILTPEGTLDRTALRQRVFGNGAELDALNAIVHPDIAALRDQSLAKAFRRGDPVVVYDVPLLFERNMAGDFDRIILVDAPIPTRVKRIIRHRGLTDTEARRMIDAQLPAEYKRPKADIVIENTGSLDDLRHQVDAAWRQLTAPKGRSSLAR